MAITGSSADQPLNQLVYVGIATVRGRSQPVYRAPGDAAAPGAERAPADTAAPRRRDAPTGVTAPGDGYEPGDLVTPLAEEPLGSVAPGDYVPHFWVTDDHGWLYVTLKDGSTGWLRNDPTYIRVHLPDPSKLRVCIDPGHGGSERGAVTNGLVESEINLDIALRLGRLLAGARGIERVWYTRTGNDTVSLKYRWDLANASFASLFVSIHNNASTDPAVRGTETYFKCGREGSAWLSASSARAACLIHEGLREQIQQFGSTFCPWVDKGVICRLVSREDPRSYYYVLQNTNLPAVLAECLYITNRADALCLGNSAFREILAQGIYQGVIDALLRDVPQPTCALETRYGL